MSQFRNGQAISLWRRGSEKHENVWKKAKVASMRGNGAPCVASDDRGHGQTVARQREIQPIKILVQILRSTQYPILKVPAITVHCGSPNPALIMAGWQRAVRWSMAGGWRMEMDFKMSLPARSTILWEIQTDFRIIVIFSAAFWMAIGCC